MNTQMGRTGIRFNDCMFSEPVPLSHWAPPRCAGLYVVLVRDANWAPKPFQPLYFGEFGHNATVPLSAKERLDLAGTPPEEVLFVAAFAMPFSTTVERLQLRSELIRAYNPPCIVPSERVRHEEEAAELRMLFANARTDFEPQPRRRRIGFIS